MRLRPRDLALLGGVAALALVAAFYVLLLRPEHRSVNQLQAQITAAQATVASAEQKEAVGHRAEVSLARSQREWVATQDAVPRVSNIPALLRLLQRSAKAAHVSMETITLSGAAGSSAAAGSATVGGATASTDHGATTIPVTLTFDGGYQALNRLVYRLDTFVQVSRGHLRVSGPLVGISQVSLTPSTTGSERNPDLSVQLTAAIYQHSAASTVLGSTAGGS